MKTKFFQIGFNKCGTTSIHHFFHANGVPSIHLDRGRLAIAMDANLNHNRHILTGYEKYCAYTDMEFLSPHIHIEGFKYYKEILQQVPEARFILNVRNVDRWVESRLRMPKRQEFRACRPTRGLGKPYDDFPPKWIYRNETYAVRYQQCHGLSSKSEVLTQWKADWHRHLKAVQEDIPTDQLLVFNIETDSPVLLCRFAGLPDSAAQHYGRENVAMSSFGQRLAHWLPSTVLRSIPRPVRRPLRSLVRKR